MLWRRTKTLDISETRIIITIIITIILQHTAYRAVSEGGFARGPQNFLNEHRKRIRLLNRLLSPLRVIKRCAPASESGRNVGNHVRSKRVKSRALPNRS